MNQIKGVGMYVIPLNMPLMELNSMFLPLNKTALMGSIGVDVKTSPSFRYNNYNNDVHRSSIRLL